MNEETLKSKAIKGAKWTSVLVVVSTILNILTTAILARLLTPADFGLLGMIIVVTGFLSFIGDAGVSNALIYHQDISKEVLSTLYWLNFVAGVLLFALIALLSPLAELYFKEPRISTYLPVFGINFLIGPVGQQFRVLLRKELAFGTLTAIEIISLVGSSAVAIALALSGFGIWSLVCRSILGTAIGSFCCLLIAIRRKWLPNFCFKISEVKSFVTFGVFQMAEQVIRYLGSNIDYFVIGRVFGAEPLGYYTMAFGLTSLPVSKINPIFNRVLFPVLAKIQKDEERFKSGFLRILRHVSALGFPVMLGMFVVAPSLVSVLYGAKWLPSVEILQILCFMGLYRSVTNPIGGIILAKGRADIGFYWSVLALLLMGTGVLAGVRWGLLGVALGSVAASCGFLWPMSFYLLRYLTGTNVKEYLNTMKFAAVGSIVMMVVLYVIGSLWLPSRESLRLLFQVGIGLLFYCGAMWIIAKPFCLEVKTIMVRGR